jgi:hypothetical protein
MSHRLTIEKQYLIEFEQAFKSARTNKYRNYLLGAGENSAAARFSDKVYPYIKQNPKFKINKQDKIFTIGSCFARNIENSLQRNGIPFASKGYTLSGDYYEIKNAGDRRGVLNAYTPHSMWQLFQLADANFPIDKGLIEISEDLYFDPLTSGLSFLNKEITLKIRRELIEIYKKLEQCNTVIITLGYIESWIDNLTNTFLNRTPYQKELRKISDRFSFFQADYTLSLLVIRQIVDFISQKTEGRAKIIITVSPVPLAATFTDKDIVIANQYSKSTLVCCAQTIADENDQVDYFPSYEMVMNSDRASAWLKDGVHINEQLVDNVITQFVEAYID